MYHKRVETYTKTAPKKYILFRNELTSNYSTRSLLDQAITLWLINFNNRPHTAFADFPLIMRVRNLYDESEHNL